MENTKAFAGNQKGLAESVPAHLVYILSVIAFASLLPKEIFAGDSGRVLLFLGFLGTWRYGWGLMHFVRAHIYIHRVYPKLRDAANKVAIKQTPPHAYLMVTSFRIDSDTTRRVYDSTIRAALRSPGGATIVASIVEMGDQRLIKKRFDQLAGENSSVRLIFVRIDGTGKRDALAYGFRAISKCAPAENDVAAVIDGDSMVPEDLVEKCSPFFSFDPKLGALTTDETCVVEGREIFRQWYSMRFAQRQILMSSMGLSKRVLTLTGRMSMFRARIVCNPDFIAGIENDYINHWRLGRIQFLTGDDKSSWFWLLKNGYRMYYVPDVNVLTVEQPPSDNFLESAAMLMTRWFGNMLRTNGRALQLGPWRMGLFTWWSILDQRMSMWTSVSSLIIAILSSLFLSPFALPAYLLWIAISRYLLGVLLWSVRGRMSVYVPFLLYFNQIFGSFIKIYIFFRLDKQKWTRQNTTNATRGIVPARARFMQASSLVVHSFYLLLLVSGLALLIGVIDLTTFGI
ncbi:MAG: glycosyltransferase [bacterium]